MSKLFSATCVVLLLCAGVAGTADARSVTNSSSSQEEVFVNWDFGTDGGTFVSGSAQGIIPKNGEPFVSIFEVSGTPITCDNDTPDFPDDDFPGTHVEVVNGSGPGTVSVDGRYRSGSASAVLDLFVDSFDDCGFFPENGGGGTVIVIEDVSVSLSAAATSSLIRSTSSSSFHIPGEVNEKFRFDSRFRTGTGTATWGEDERSGFAQIGKVSWRFHNNS